MHNPIASILPSTSTINTATKISQISEISPKPKVQNLNNYYEDVKRPKMGVKGLKATDKISWYIHPNLEMLSDSTIEKNRDLEKLKHGKKFFTLNKK